MTPAEAVRAALAAARAGRLFEAEDRLRGALQATDHLDVAANLAAVLQLQGRPDAACAALLPRLDRGVVHPVAWNTLGVAQMDRGDLLEAAQSFRRAADQDPAAILPLVHLHAALFDDGDTAPAREALDRAARIHKLHPAVRFHLGVLWGLLAPEAAVAHHRVLPPEAAAWRDSWAFVLEQRDPRTRLFGAAADTLRYAARLAPADGFVVELGVRFGTTARLLQAALGGTLHGFDTFEGLPQAWHTVPAGAYSTGGRVPDLGRDVVLHRGRFSETVPRFAQAQAGVARLVHIDCDLYASTLAGLTPLADQLVPGTVLVFDDYLMNPRWREDEHRALVELGRQRGWRWRYAAFSLFSHQAVVVLE